jgi:hypothetical protein
VSKAEEQSKGASLEKMNRMLALKGSTLELNF